MQLDKVILPKESLKRLHIFLTTQCNLRCIMCSAKDKLDIYPPIELKQDSLIKLSDSIEYPIRFNFTGGEPLVYFSKNPDVLYHIAQNENIHLGFITNGTLLDDEIVNILASARNGFTMAFSVDGYQDVYEQIRIGSKWDLVDQNIKIMSELTKGNLKNNIYVRYLLMNKNIHCYSEFIDYALKNWNLTHIETDILLLGKDLGNKNLMLNAEDKEYFSTCISQLRANGYNMQNDGSILIQESVYHQIAELTDGWIRSVEPCNIPFFGMSIYYDGNIVPCCNSTNFCFGNIEKNNIYDIWNGSAIQSVRKEILQGKKHYLCMCNNITLKKNKNYKEAEFDSAESRVATSTHVRKKYIENILHRYREEFKPKSDTSFLESCDISPWDKLSVPVYSELASMYLYRTKDFDRADELCDVILNIYPYHYETWIKKAILSFNKGNKEEAMCIIEDMVFPQNRSHTIANFWMGSFKESGFPLEAKRFYEIFVNSEDVDKTSWGYRHAQDWLKKFVFSQSLKGCQEKIKKDKDLTIVSFGSCWLAKNSFNSIFVQALQQELPEVKIKHFFAAMGSAVASSCFLRLEQDVIVKNPDLVIIHCFFVHLENNVLYPEQYTDEVHFVESIIRRLISFNPFISIILIPHFSFKFEVYKYPVDLANHYNICMLSTPDVFEDIAKKENCSVEQDIYDDHSHLSDFGKQVFGQYLFESFKPFIVGDDKTSYPKLPTNKLFDISYDKVDFIHGEVIQDHCNWHAEIKQSFNTISLKNKILFTTDKPLDTLDINIIGNDFIFWFGINVKGVIYIEIDKKLYKYQMRLWGMQNKLYEEQGLLFAFDSILISCEDRGLKERRIKVYMPEDQPIEDFKMEFWGIGVLS